ncbi:MAG: SoxR reducing system RseC family protein [bacterium]
MLNEPVSNGKVVRKDGDMVDILVARSERCKSCGLCFSMGNDKILIRVKTDSPVEIGEEVRIFTEDRYVILSAFILYIVPVIALILGYFLGSIFSNKEPFKIVSGFLFMGLAFIFNRFIDKRVRFPQRVEPIK